MGSSKHPVSTLEASSLQGREVIVYTSSGCPKCSVLKGWLRNSHTPFEERSLEDAEVMANLIMRNVFILSAPALETKGIVYTEDQIFERDGTVKTKFSNILEEKLDENK